MSALQRRLCFVTGNIKKLEEVQQILSKDGSISIYNNKLDLPELQGEPSYVAEEKCKLAFDQVKCPVIVEDTSLCYNALNGLPGVYIKWFLEKTGHDGLNRILAGYDDKSAYAQCIFALATPKSENPEECDVKLFVGRTEGEIVAPRGNTDFGWDPIFEAHEGDQGLKTFGEMTSEEKNLISHRSKALQQLQEYLSENPLAA